MMHAEKVHESGNQCRECFVANAKPLVDDSAVLRLKGLLGGLARLTQRGNLIIYNVIRSFQSSLN